MSRRTASVLVAVAVAGAAWAGPDPFDVLVARTDALAREVARVRGLRVKRPIAKELIDRAELTARLAALAADEHTRRTTEAEAFGLARWGLIAPATDYPALLAALRGEQILGYYDPQARRLAIARGELGDAAQAELVLAHELQHALQDQAFDLAAFEDVPDTDGDARRARRALVEGDALATMIELVLARRGAHPPWADPEVTAALEKGMTIPRGDGLDAAPLAVREALMFPYHAGVGFVAALRRRQPWSAVDAAFARPPRSTEQVLHPERYQAGDAPIAVALAPPPSLPGWTVAQSTVWGELGFTLFLRAQGIEGAQAALAGEGWGGDRVLVLARPGDPRPERGAGVARFAWDSEADAIEAAEAAEKALDRAAVGATIEHTYVRTRWLSLDGTVAWIERRGPVLVMAIGVPIWVAGAVAAELWAP